MLHVRRHHPHVGNPTLELRGSGRRQPLYQHQVLRCVDEGCRDSKTVPELEDVADGPDEPCPVPGMGQGWERDLYNWDENGVGVAPPKPAPLSILLYYMGIFSQPIQ